MSESISTSFGTKLRPINTEISVFRLNNDKELSIDTPIEDIVGTKKIFKKGSVIEGTVWLELREDGKTRKVVMVQEGREGRYIVPMGNLLQTTKEAVEDTDKAKKELDELKDKVEDVIESAKEEAEKIIGNKPKSFLESDFMGFKGKQILVASLGVIILIKLFK
jgi:hypothetical protein|tara:strand:- start:17030 stop:17521 length:492 start_codon:yes stop_codon:yes gene_type:complete